MSLPADCSVYKNGLKKGVGQQNRKNRNSKRRKPKNMSRMMQDDECDDKIREIINLLSSAITSTSHGKMCQDKSSPIQGSTSTDSAASADHHDKIQRNFAEPDKNRPSTSDACLSSLVENVREEKFEKCVKQKYKSPISSPHLCDDENLNISFKRSEIENSLNLTQSLLNKPKSIGSAAYCPEGNSAMKKCVINKDASESGCSIKEKKQNLLDNRREDNFRSDKSTDDKKKANNKLKKTRRAKVKTIVKVAKASTESDVEAGEFNGENTVIINNSFNHEDQGLGKGSGGGSPKDTPTTSKLPKSEKKGLTDTKFPKYLTEDEMDCASRFGIILSGMIRINQKNFQEAYISAPDKGMDILIVGLIDRNRALEGDEVYYVLKGQENFRISNDNGEIQRTAAVVAIKNQQHCRGAVGTVKLQDGKAGVALFSPRDSRIPRIIIKKRDWPPWFSEDSLSYSKRLFYAQIKQWNDVRFAEGILTKEVGFVGDIESETSAILLMLELDGTPYSDALKTYLPKLPYVISEKDLEKRQDFRKECIFTIDPASAKDLDDAVSCKVLPNGNYRIGVHISDVTHFLSQGSPLDAAVAEKATTIYLVQKVYHMLPRELCELCSLTPGEDKLAFSVLWEMTPDFEVVMYDFTRSVINSCGKFSYDQIQEILDGSENPSLPDLHGGHTVQDVINTVKLLNTIAVHLRRKRFENGALRIDQTKIVFSLDETGFPLSYEVYVNKEAHRLIEEFMLLANITVAKWISLYFPKVAFLRSHSPPQSYMMKRLKKNLEKYGIDLDISSSNSLHESLTKYSGSDLHSTARLMVLNTLLAKPMARANYYCSGFCSEDEDKRHYALNVPLYTHFTSPIRRYADVMVHRLLAASLGYCQVPDWTPEDVHKIADNCNKKKYAAKLAGEKSTELFLNIFTLRQNSIICRGAVCDIKNKSFDCILLENGSHQRVYVENMKVSWSVENENGIMRLIINWPKSEDKEEAVQVIELFSIVKIELRKSKEENKIKAFLLRSD